MRSSRPGFLRWRGLRGGEEPRLPGGAAAPGACVGSCSLVPFDGSCSAGRGQAWHPRRADDSSWRLRPCCGSLASTRLEGEVEEGDRRAAVRLSQLYVLFLRAGGSDSVTWVGNR